MKALRTPTTRMLPGITIVWVLLELLSLRLGLLNRFFFDAMHAEVQGIDYFSLPKAWLNLAAGRSAFDTFGPPAYGPHFTWYLSHPALAVVLGSWLSRFDAADAMSSYGAFTMLSLAMMAASAWLLARASTDALHRRLIWLFVLGAFPTYWMLFVGNVQATLVLALTLVFSGLLRMLREEGTGVGASGTAVKWIFAGLLLSLLSKPVVLLMLPLFLLLSETRRAAAWALGWYVAISALFEFVPFLNPEAISLQQVLWLAAHPGFVRDNMNIYANGFKVTTLMKDNSIHWLNLVAQSQTRLMHVDVFSLPVFLDGLFGFRTPDWLYTLPSLALLALSVPVARMRDRRSRLVSAILLASSISLLFFVNYPTVWEYQYTAILPVGAVLLVLRERGLLSGPLGRAMLCAAACAWLPSLFFLVDCAPLTSGSLSIIRADRIVPATILLVLLFVAVLQHVRTSVPSKS